MKCYKCGEVGQKSFDCGKACSCEGKQLLIVDYQEEEERVPTSCLFPKYSLLYCKCFSYIYGMDRVRLILRKATLFVHSLFIFINMVSELGIFELFPSL